MELGKNQLYEFDKSIQSKINLNDKKERKIKKQK